MLYSDFIGQIRQKVQAVRLKVVGSVLAVAVVMAGAFGLIGPAGRHVVVAAKTDTQLPQQTAVDRANALVRAGEVWDAAVTLLAELRELPPDAESIDDALAPMQCFSNILCSLMPVEDLQVFVEQLDPAYAGDAVALAAFYRDYAKGWQKDKGIHLVTEDTHGSFLDDLIGSETALVRMGGLLYKLLCGSEEFEEDRDAALRVAVQVVNQMADECPECRVTREAFREVVSRSVRPSNDNPAESVWEVLADPRWNEPVQWLIASDEVAQTLLDIVESAAVASAKTQAEIAGGLFEGAMNAARSGADSDVRAWFRNYLSFYLAPDRIDSDFGARVRAMFAEEVDFLLEAPEAGPLPLDTAVAQRALFLADLRKLEAAKWSTGKSVVGPYLSHWESLLNQKRDAEPVSANFFERLDVEVVFYGYMNLNQDLYVEAAEILRRVIEVYPNSERARHCQTTIDHLIWAALIAP